MRTTRAHRNLGLGLSAAALLFGCGVHDVVPYARVAFEAAPEPSTVLALRSSCTDTTGVAIGGGRPTCDFDRENAVDEIVRATLEFAGHQVVDSERIDPAATSPDKVWKYDAEESEDGADTAHTLSMDDLTPTHRRALSELGVEGIVSTAVVGGPIRRMRGVEWVEVQIQMTRMDSSAPVWRSHCRAMVYEGERVVQTVARALEQATSCAIEAPGALRRASRPTQEASP